MSDMEQNPAVEKNAEAPAGPSDSPAMDSDLREGLLFAKEEMIKRLDAFSYTPEKRGELIVDIFAAVMLEVERGKLPLTPAQVKALNPLIVALFDQTVALTFTKKSLPTIAAKQKGSVTFFEGEMGSSEHLASLVTAFLDENGILNQKGLLELKKINPALTDGQGKVQALQLRRIYGIDKDLTEEVGPEEFAKIVGSWNTLN